MSTPLIGVVDQKIESKEHEAWNVNKIGGTPSWLSLSPPPPPVCELCGRQCVLVSQLYCPLGGSAYHRCLYVFVCLSHCSKKPQGWKVFRSLKLDESYTESECDDHAIADDWSSEADSWLDDQNDWGDPASDDWGQGSEGHTEVEKDAVSSSSTDTESLEKPTDSSCTEDMETAAFARLTISEDAPNTNKSPNAPDMVPNSAQCQGDVGTLMEEPMLLVQDEERLNAVTALLNTPLSQTSAANTPHTTPTVSSLQPYFLYVIEEPAATQVDETSSHMTSSHIAELIRTYEQAEGTTLDNIVAAGGKKSGKGSKESYEKAELKHGDKIFHKFHKRLQRCPKQCVRYERGGDPLLIRPLEPSDQVSVSACSLCGGQRLFELQLLPPLIPSLKLTDGTPSPVEFGTVLIFTCANNCLSGDLMEELVLIQADPDEHLYTKLHT